MIDMTSYDYDNYHMNLQIIEPNIINAPSLLNFGTFLKGILSMD